MLATFEPYPAMKDSGVEWLGAVPAHWQVSMTKRHYDIQLGKMLQTTPSGPDDVEVPYLKAKDVQWFRVQVTNTSTMWASLAELDQFGITPGDLLVCEGGEGGRCGILKHKVDGYIIQNALHRVRPRLESRNDYLQYVMMSVAATGWFEALNDKATIAHFTREKFGSLGIPIPSGDEQAAIVRFLNQADRRIQRYIRAKEKLIALLEEQKQAIIYEAVTGRIDVRTGKPYPAYKPSGIEWLGDTPEHWEARRLGSIARVFNGATPSRARSDYWTNGTVPWLKSSKVNDEFVTEPSEYITRRAVDECSVSLVPSEAVVVGLVGQGKTRGMSALVKIRTTISQNLAAIVPVHAILGAYLHRYLSAHYEHLRYLGRGGNQEALNCDLVGRLRVLVPPEVEQRSVVGYLGKRLSALDVARQNEGRQIELLSEYRTRLITDVVTGKLDVREAVAALPEKPGLSGNDRAEVEDAIGIRTEALEMTDWETCPAVERKPGKVSGAWVFAGTRIPLSALYENLAGGATIAEFVEWFPGVDEQQVRTVLEHEAKALRTATAP